MEHHGILLDWSFTAVCLFYRSKQLNNSNALLLHRRKQKTALNVNWETNGAISFPTNRRGRECWWAVVEWAHHRISTTATRSGVKPVMGLLMTLHGFNSWYFDYYQKFHFQARVNSVESELICVVVFLTSAGCHMLWRSSKITGSFASWPSIHSRLSFLTKNSTACSMDKPTPRLSVTRGFHTSQTVLH